MSAFACMYTWFKLSWFAFLVEIFRLNGQSRDLSTITGNKNTPSLHSWLFFWAARKQQQLAVKPPMIENEPRISTRIRPHFLGSRARPTTKMSATQVPSSHFDINISLPETFRSFLYLLISKVCRFTWSALKNLSKYSGRERRWSPPTLSVTAIENLITNLVHDVYITYNINLKYVL